MPRLCFTLDLQDDPALIAEYEEYHKNVWVEIRDGIYAAGVEQMEIYRWGNRLFMVMEVTNAFNPEQKARADAANLKVQEWEKLMWRYQQALPGAKEGEKWQPMKEIFSLRKQ